MAIHHLATKGLFGALALLLFFSIGCIDNESPQQQACTELAQLDTVKTLQSSKVFIPYSADVSKLIFSDVDGNEIEGIVRYYDTDLIPFSNGIAIACPLDENVKIRPNWLAEVTAITVDVTSLDLQIQGTVYPTVYTNSVPDIQVSDWSTYGIYFPIGSSSPIVLNQFTIDQRGSLNNRPTYLEFFPYFNIHDKSYQQVYQAGNPGTTGYTLYYNETHGIVGFENIDGTVKYKFERAE